MFPSVDASNCILLTWFMPNLLESPGGFNKISTKFEWFTHFFFKDLNIAQLMFIYVHIQLANLIRKTNYLNFLTKPSK